jgi:hypothetical protein
MALSAAAEQGLQAIAAQYEAATPDQVARIEAEIPVLGPFLQHSEEKLIALMAGQKPPESDPGSVEFGLVLYWIDGSSMPAWFKNLFPTTQITKTLYDSWKTTIQGPGVVASDGTLLSNVTFAQMDPGWLEPAVQYIFLKIGLITKQPFGVNQAGTITTISGDNPSVAVLGDWGTGKWQDGNDANGPAISIIDQIGAMNPAPDLTIHLGDVYYAGTEIQEEALFLDPWIAGSQGTFALNSNHEMYPGGTGYFEKTLTDQRFAAQVQASYFAINLADWVIIGLDSAYDIDFPTNTTTPFLLDGRITDSDQADFVKGLDLLDANQVRKKIMVMTHHTGIATDGTGEPLALMGDINTMLAANPAYASAEAAYPDYWYWGHVHNGIVYKDSAPGLAGTGIQARCAGHGAIPFGNGYGLDGNANVEWYAQTPYSALATPTPQQVNRVLNGYAILTFSGSTVTEEFYNQGDSATPIYTVPPAGG